MPEPVFICGPSREYYLGDPQPPQEAGYSDFVEWRESQIRRRKRPKAKKQRRAELLSRANEARPV